ncbi:NEK protein kinase [Blastomyces dermatitidis ATCC 18188]|uniref:non-specific serine/threonine protein kinase n=1 Tax=Ajellomyces dermatitidis (strain ATCC 18188 / CBS 674.68) TaxID=653446 RepID=F2TSJ1_AJEDA|nr:NEK protein kinase [Blastomyces dermatitidis ATCC 18188]
MVKGREPSQGPSVDSKANPKNSAREEISLLFPHPSFQFTPSLSLQRRSHQQNQPEDEQDQHHHRTPPGFHRRFQKAYKPGNEWFQIPGPDAIRYYEEELTRNDLGLDSEWEYADEFRRQLRKFVHLTEVEAYVSEYEEDEYGCDLRWKYQGLPSEENQWIYMGELGEGGFGYVQCWEWYPFGNRDPIRFAVKDTQNDQFWHDYCSEGNLTRRVNATGCPNVVKVYDWIDLDPQPPELIAHNRTFRILYEYYEGGSLSNLYTHYMEYKLLLPEAFLWHLFHEIATALLYCAHGHEGPMRKPDWEEIIHKDVKPGNILLGAVPSPNSEELYPTCYLSDFGLAYTIPNDDVRAYKKAYPLEGTVEFLPPEAVDRFSSGVIGPKLDIYSLTLSIREAIEMALHMYTADEMNTLRKLPGGGNYLPYSLDLINLCRAAGSSRTYRRPDIYSLWRMTGEQAKKWKGEVRANRRRVEAKRANCYDGMVLIDHDVRRRFQRDRAFRREFLREASWEHRNRGVVKLGKAIVKRINEEKQNGEGYRDWIGSAVDRAGMREGSCASEGTEPWGQPESWSWTKRRARGYI